jgi:uncharacterized protein YjbI with pentapeptide repeats
MQSRASAHQGVQALRDVAASPCLRQPLLHFIDSDLRDADLCDDLEGADFRGTDLRGADLRETFLTATQFADRHRETKIEGARFLGSDIDRAGLGDDDRAFLLNAVNAAIIE